MTNPQQNALAEALEPCPFCQSASVSMSFSATMTDPDPACRFVECEECSAMGPVVHIEVDDGYAQSQAIVAWNRRASNNPAAVEGQGEVTEAMWGGLARDIMMWLDFGPGERTPRALFKHLERCGRDIPQWLRDEPEMKALDHTPSKGTRCVLIYRAMREAALAPNADREGV